MNSNAYARARMFAAMEAANWRGGVPSYGTKPAYPSCPQDTMGAVQGGTPPLEPPPEQAEHVPASDDVALVIAMVTP